MPIFLLTLLKGKSLRYLIIALMAFSVAVGAYVVYNKIWNSGYDTAQVEYQAKQLKEIQRAVAQARIEWELSAQLAAALLDKERRTQKEIQDVINQIPSAVSDSSCTHIGASALRLYNLAIKGSDAAAARSPDQGVP